jgi:hypothetical protein
MDLQEVGWGVIDWIDLAHLWFRKMRGISSLVANPLASQEGLCSME